jgi:hypothetical protein
MRRIKIQTNHADRPGTVIHLFKTEKVPCLESRMESRESPGIRGFPGGRFCVLNPGLNQSP